VSYEHRFHTRERSRNLTPFAFNAAMIDLAEDFSGVQSVVVGHLLHDIAAEVVGESEDRTLALYDSLRQALSETAGEPLSAEVMERMDRLRHSVVLDQVTIFYDGTALLNAWNGGAIASLPWMEVEPTPDNSNSLASFFERMAGLSTMHGLPTPVALQEAERVWASLPVLVGTSLLHPSAGPAEDGSLMLSWNTDDDYLELEFFADGRWEVFYRDKAESGPTSVLSVDALQPGDTLPPEAVAKLQRFTQSV